MVYKSLINNWTYTDFILLTFITNTELHVCICVLQHQPLRDCNVNDHLPDVAKCGHTHSHLTETLSVEETKDALPLDKHLSGVINTTRWC